MAYKYIITDSQDIPVARALLESEPNADVWQIRVLDGGVAAVLEHEIIQLISLDASAPAKAGRILRHRNDILMLEPVTALGEEVRQNLRVAASFKSFIYPVTGTWQGRIPVTVHDLSCGGIAFFCDTPLEKGEIVEIVVSLVEPPLLIHTAIIRPRPSNSPVQLYAAKFVDTVDSEEAAIREAVFSHQIQTRRK